MADKRDKYSDNVPGKYYVDRECIFCNVCANAAPNNFRISDDGTHDVVYKQPENEDEGYHEHKHYTDALDEDSELGEKGLNYAELARQELIRRRGYAQGGIASIRKVA